ncbi:MAG: hypothetical protein O3B41_02875 [Bacteroidetes bacterium]|nr:hypothetical protein [Bacteroidota bacterium]
MTLSLGLAPWVKAQDIKPKESEFESKKWPLPSAIDTLVVTGSGPFLVRPYIIAETLQIRVRGSVVPPEEYSLDFAQGFVTFSNVHPDSAFVFVASYQFVPVELQSEYHLWEMVDPSENKSDPGKSAAPNPLSRLQSSGSITRGVLSGTGRDASVESGLRLEVEGEITDSISVRAVLTDEDTPILPEGTTSKLEQFDQIFIEFASPKGKIALGDLDVSMQEGEFSRVKRRVQGVNVLSNAVSFSSLLVPKTSFQVSGATSKGKFRSQFVTIIEGVQGPYRLEGETSERFILVLPGTERVYVDGQLLERGIASDYIVDYTTAEITFMPTRLIAPNDRVRVEFEYTTNQFSRSFLAAEASATIGGRKEKSNFNFGVSAIREADGDSFAEELGFTSQDSLIIRGAGDQIIFATGATEVIFDTEAFYVQYFLSTGFDGQLAFVPVERTPENDEKVYRVTFTRIGEGKGSYKRLGSSSSISKTNGIVYTYVGLGLGEYDAVRPLTPPSSKEILDLRLQSKALPFGEFRAEWATSRNDYNTLSSIDSADDEGTASSFRFASTSVAFGNYSAVGKADFTRRSANFSTFDRTRSIEFERDWNLSSTNLDPLQSVLIGTSESEYGAELAIIRVDSSKLSLGYDVLSLGNVLSASRKRLSLLVSEKKWPEFRVNARQVSSENNRLSARGDWHNIVSKVLKGRLGSLISTYLEWESERFSGDQMELTEPRLRLDFDEIRLGSQLGRANNRVTLFFEQRFENEEEAARENSIQTLQSKWAFQKDADLRASASVGLRRARQNSGRFANSSPNQTALLLGTDGDWQMSAQNRLSWLYQVQSEQTSRLQEIYIRTGQERGEYVWEDLNDDGVIQIEEFIPETTPNEGEYSVTYFPSDSLEFVTSLTANARFSRAGGGSGNRLSRIGLSSVVEVLEKTRDPDRSNVYFLQLDTFRSRDFTVNGRLRAGQEIRFLPSNTRFDLDVSGSEIWAYTDLASGEQRTKTSEVDAQFVFRPRPEWVLTGRIARRIDYSKAGFASRNYDIEGLEFSPSLSFRPKREWSIILGAELANRRERNEGTKAFAVQIPWTIQYQNGAKWTARARIEMANVRITGTSKGLQTFHLTEGRGAGASWLWGLTFNARLTDVLTATFGYDGRAPNKSETIHTGRVQFTARF